MRDFESLISFCHFSAKDISRSAFYDMAYVGAYERMEHYRDNNQSGHYQQLFYAIYDFLTINKNLIDEITPPPFEISDSINVLRAWNCFLNDGTNSTDEYDIDSLIKNLPPKCGGNRYGGGGWGKTLKIMFPVVAKYINE